MLFQTFKWLKASPKMSIYEYLLSFSYLSSAVMLIFDLLLKSYNECYYIVVVMDVSNNNYLPDNQNIFCFDFQLKIVV